MKGARGRVRKQARPVVLLPGRQASSPPAIIAPPMRRSYIKDFTAAQSLTTYPLGDDMPQDVTAGKSLNLLRHELRTPLTGMLSLAEMLSALDLPGRAPCWLATLQACGQHMAALIDRSLRAEAQSPEAAKRSGIDGLKLLETLVISHWPAAQHQGIKLLLIFQPEAQVHWQVDAVALRQALDNLLSNAIRFTRNGQVTLEARVIPRADTGQDQLELRVEDSGLGLTNSPSNLRDDSDYADRTYRMFSHGLGLFVVEQFCQHYSGQLQPSASSMGGASFALQLPGVLAPQRSSSPPFRPAILQKLHCILWLELPQQRALAAMLACLDISFDCISSMEAFMRASGSPNPLLICTKNRLPQSLLPESFSMGAMLKHQDANANPICLLAVRQGEKAVEYAWQVLPEPLFQADLQTALLRALVLSHAKAPSPQVLPE